MPMSNDSASTSWAGGPLVRKPVRRFATRGSMAATGLIIFAFTWNEFLFAVAISSDRAITVPVHIAGAIDTRGVQFWFMGVRAMTAMIPPVIIALIAQRYIVRGLTLGAVRG